MESAIDALPPGTKVRWLEMRGEALLGVSLPEQAFASFVRCFEVGMATMLTVYLPCTYTYLVHVHAHAHVHVPCTMSMSMSMSMFHVPCTMSMPCPYAPATCLPLRGGDGRVWHRAARPGDGAGARQRAPGPRALRQEGPRRPAWARRTAGPGAGQDHARPRQARQAAEQGGRRRARRGAGARRTLR